MAPAIEDQPSAPFKLFGARITPTLAKAIIEDQPTAPFKLFGARITPTLANFDTWNSTLSTTSPRNPQPLPIQDSDVKPSGSQGRIQESTEDASIHISDDGSHPDNQIDEGEKAQSPHRREQEENVTKDTVDDKKKKKKKKKISTINSRVLEAPPGLDQVPSWIVQIVESRHGTEPVFLYQKRLQVSDTEPGQNRLFVNETGELMRFLTEEERRAVMQENKSVAVDALDAEDNLYKLEIALWGSVKKVILKGKWIKLILANGVKAGDIVQLWGYRYRDNEVNNVGIIANFNKNPSS